jgi:hypothetical protein
VFGGNKAAVELAAAAGRRSCQLWIYSVLNQAGTQNSASVAQEPLLKLLYAHLAQTEDVH